jgi:hypothetical protein
MNRKFISQNSIVLAQYKCSAEAENILETVGSSETPKFMPLHSSLKTYYNIILHLPSDLFS